MKITVANSFFESLKDLNSFKQKYYSVISWLRYHTSKDFFKILKELLKSYPYDNCYLLRIERAKLLEMINYHKKVQGFVGWEKCVRDMKICVSLIGIMIEDEDLFHFNGDLIFNKNENNEYEINHTPDFEYICDVSVNTKNINRFISDNKMQKFYLEHPHELYVKKATYLYHKIRYEREFEWWY